MKGVSGRAMNALLEIIEDLKLAALMDAVADDETLEGEASWQAYRQYCEEVEQPDWQRSE
jgi:hypothetical protein